MRLGHARTATGLSTRLSAALLAVASAAAVPALAAQAPGDGQAPSSGLQHGMGMAAASPCREGGLLDCGGAKAPGPADGLCDWLATALAGRRIDGVMVASVTACALQRPTAATAATADATPAGLAALASLQVALQDGPPSHLGLLLLRSSDGWRIADAVLPVAWTHGGACMLRMTLRWQGPAAERRLHLRAERACHQPLDRAERAAGADSLASLACHDLHYAQRDGRWLRTSASSRDARCRWR